MTRRPPLGFFHFISRTLPFSQLRSQVSAHIDQLGKTSPLRLPRILVIIITFSIAAVLAASIPAGAGVPGILKWAFATGGLVYSSPSIGTDGTIYIGSGDKLYAINPNGTQKWAFGTLFPPNIFPPNIPPSPGPVLSPSIGTDGTIFVRSGPFLYALNPDGTPKWAFNNCPGSGFDSYQAIGMNGTIYIGSGDGKLYAINPNGTQKWAFSLGYFVDCLTPSIGVDGTIYVGSFGGLYAINPDGTQKWAFSTGEWVSSTSSAIGADSTIYVGSGPFLYALNPDGTQKWAYATGYSWYSSPSIDVDGTIYIGSGNDGKLYSIYSSSSGLANSSWPMFHHDVRHTGRAGYIPPPPIPCLSFDQSPPNPATVGTPFPLTITARKVDGTVDTGFNGYVTLFGQALRLDKGFVPLINGVWSGQLTINYGEGANLVIQAEGGGLWGRSNPFNTTNSATALGNLYGLVTNDAANSLTPIAGATVHLSLTAGGPDKYTTQTDASGQFSFPSVNADKYYLWATKEGATSYWKYRVTVSGSMSHNLQIRMAGDPNQLPAILVPGIMGSSDSSIRYKYSLIPRLPKTGYDREQLNIFDIDNCWESLKEILKQKKVPIIECPWDWRMPIDQAMKTYLKDAISEARRVDPTDPNSPISPTKKVNIIAHSMGGLLARAYIQDEDYQNDVENLVLVGTPHKGSANAYCIWEGGDPWKADEMLGLNFKPAYSATLSTLILDSGLPFLPNYLDLFSIKNFVHQHVRTVKQLLPTYEFLKSGNALKALSSSDENINTDLKNLNSGTNGYIKPDHRMGPPNNTAGKVKTQVYYCDNVKTVGNINVINSTRSEYEDGEPKGEPSITIGDGTVPDHSALLPYNEGWADHQFVTGSHVDLVGSATQLVTSYLYPAPATANLPQRAAATAFTPTFFVTFNGWLQPYLADSQGRALGFNLTSSALEKTIPQATISTEANFGSLGVDNPADGLYTLYLKGKYPGAYRVNIGYQSGGNFTTQDLAGYNNANTTTITIKVDSTNPARIIINPPIAAPASVTSSNVQGKTYLTWQASTGAVSYEIYALLPGSSDYVLIGTTTNTDFMTNDSWLADASATPTVYEIVTVKADGTESLFSAPAANKPLAPNKKKTSIASIINLLLSH